MCRFSFEFLSWNLKSTCIIVLSIFTSLHQRQHRKYLDRLPGTVVTFSRWNCVLRSDFLCLNSNSPVEIHRLTIEVNRVHVMSWIQMRDWFNGFYNARTDVQCDEWFDRPNVSHLFGLLKKHLDGRRFIADDKVHQVISACVQGLTSIPGVRIDQIFVRK